MKLLARADFYQQKMKELEKLDLQFEKKKAPCSSETIDSENSALSSLQVQLATNKFKIRPRRIKIWYFDYACKKAMMFAEHYGFDIQCEIGGGWGHIHLWADMLYSDTSWKEEKYLQMLFSILHNADVVIIEPAICERNGQIHIMLSYRLVKTSPKERVNTSLMQNSKPYKSDDHSKEMMNYSQPPRTLSDVNEQFEENNLDTPYVY